MVLFYLSKEVLFHHSLPGGFFPPFEISQILPGSCVDTDRPFDRSLGLSAGERDDQEP